MERNGGRYGARAFSITKRHDTIQLPDEPDVREGIAWMIDHLGQLGVEHAAKEDIIWDSRPEVAKRYPHLPLSVYFYGDTINKVRPNARRHEATIFFADKNNFIRYCQSDEHPHPVLPTQILEDGEQPNYDIIKYPVKLKPTGSTRGQGFKDAYSEEELISKLEGFRGGLQIQKLVEKEWRAEWLSVQYKVIDGKAELLASMEQVMNGDVHIGNRHPTRHDISRLTDPLAQEMADAGLEDVFGLDLVAFPSPKGGFDYRFIEANPRFTGATAPILMAKKLGIVSWTSRSLPAKLATPAELDLGDLAFDPDKAKGIVGLNSCRLDMGGLWPPGFEVLIAGTPEQQEELLPKVQHALNEPARKRLIRVPEAVAS